MFHKAEGSLSNVHFFLLCIKSYIELVPIIARFPALLAGSNIVFASSLVRVVCISYD